MIDRMIYVTGSKRVTWLNSHYPFNNHGFKKGDYLFKLDELSRLEKELFKKMTNELKPFLKILFSDINCIILKVIPEKDLIDELDNYSSESLSLNDFIIRLVKYFSHSSMPLKWVLKNKVLDFKNAPLIMGILNTTPDSFSDGGLFTDKTKAVEHALKMVEDGADIIDIGGESTRPGAEPVAEEQELARVILVIEGIRKFSNVAISIDTYKSSVANQALVAGADIINDISSADYDPEMISVIQKNGCPVILMHKQGMPQDMQKNPVYNDVQEEVYHFLAKKSSEIELINDGKIIIDPGIGFGKTINHNLSLIRDVIDFSFIGKPVLLGLSRKSFIGKTLDVEIDNRIIGSIVSEFYTVLNGVNLLRVHDVKETVQAKKMITNILAA